MILAFLFNDVGAGEWLVLLAVILVVVGPKRLPEVARKFGQYYSKFRRAAENFKRQLLDMDSEFSQAVRDVEQVAQDAESATQDAFAIEGDEASAIPDTPQNEDSANNQS